MQVKTTFPQIYNPRQGKRFDGDIIIKKATDKGVSAESQIKLVDLFGENRSD